MKLLHQLIKLFWLLIIISVGLGQELRLENNNGETWNVLYAIPPELAIADFQFDVDGDGVTVDNAYGGAAEDAGFTITASSTTVVGFSPTQATIPPATGGIRVVLELSGEPTGLSNMVFSDSDENDMVFTFIWEGCPDDSACNFDENATEDNGNGSCTYPASDLVDCDGNCCAANDPECDMAHPADCAGECDGSVMDDDSCTGCMDDGYQQLSPNPGSPACNYAQFAIIEGECDYIDCAGNCPTDDGYELIELDDCGECGGGDSTCSDCNGVPYGIAYINPLCIGIDNNEDGCVGGDTGHPDCLNIDLSFGEYMESNSTDTIKVFVTNLDTLKSLDIEFQYDSSIINITEFSLYGTALNPIGSYYYEYEMAYDTFVESGKVNFILYFEPHTNTDTLFSLNGEEHIFNIVLEAMEIEANITTQITINEFFVNEILMGETNWEGGEISVVVPKGCTEELACNYDLTATSDDGSCWSETQGCACDDGEGSIADNCGTCDNDLSNDCVMDCNNEWGGHAYGDNCGACIIGSEDIDCFMSSFNLYNSNGNIIENDIIPELDTLYVALHMQNLPDSLEGIIVNLGFDTSILSLDDWSINPNDLNIEGGLTGELGDSYIVEGEIIDTTFRASIHGITNELYQENGGNILFLQFSISGNNGDSTVISYNEILINEHVMKEQNYTSQVIYFGELSTNEILIPKNFKLSQNYPNPFNPITYIQYIVPNFDFITIDIINISGQIIKTIVQSSHQPGNYEIMWEGTNHYGISVPSGIYFYKMNASNFISVRKLVLLK